MAWAKIDPTAEQTYWDSELYVQGTLWDNSNTIWDFSQNTLDTWTKLEAEQQ